MSCLAGRAIDFASGELSAISATYLAGRKGRPILMGNLGDNFDLLVGQMFLADWLYS